MDANESWLPALALALVVALLVLLGLAVLRRRRAERLRSTELLGLRRANVELAQRIERLEGERVLATSVAQAERERALQGARDAEADARRRAEAALQAERALFAAGGAVRRFGFGVEPPYAMSGPSGLDAPGEPSGAAGPAAPAGLLSLIDPADHAALRECIASAAAEPGSLRGCELRAARNEGGEAGEGIEGTEAGQGARLRLQLRVDAAPDGSRSGQGYLVEVAAPPAPAEPATAHSDDLQNLVRTMSAGQRFMESLQQLTELLQRCETRAQGLEVIAQGGPALFPRWDGAIDVAGSDGFGRIAARWGEFFETEPGKAVDCWAARRNRVHATGAGGRATRLSPVCGHFGSGAKLPPGMTHAICVPLTAPAAPPVLLHLVTHAPLDEDALATATWAAETLAHALELSLANLDLRISLREQAVRDAMTGLYNRRHFDQVLALETSRAQRAGDNLVLALFDIDHFKAFNDSFGHEAGDVVIKAVAAELLGFVRSYDTACRVGGEELTVLLPSARLEESCARLEQLRGQIAQLRLAHGEQALDAVTVSIGVADLECGPHETLLRRADMALYAAKRGGRNQLVCWLPELPDVTDFAPLVKEAASP